MLSYLGPLKFLGVPQTTNPTSFLFKKGLSFTIPFQKYKVLAPSAAWELKRWPIDHWKNLILATKGEKYVILGGQEDGFCQDLANLNKEDCLNLAGRLTLMESAFIVSKSEMIIGGDTGLLHLADLMGVKGIMIIGPSAFGFPTGNHIRILEASLPCRPCSKDGRGKCTNKIHKRCLQEVRPDQVLGLLK
jgi:heptosyltransferase-2